MATRKKPEEYVSKATTTRIVAVSRVSKKIDETFYTLEYSEERTIPEDANVEKERKILWDVVNGEVDRQVDDIYDLVYKEKQKFNKK